MMRDITLAVIFVGLPIVALYFAIRMRHDDSDRWPLDDGSDS